MRKESAAGRSARVGIVGLRAEIGQESIAPCWVLVQANTTTSVQERGRRCIRGHTDTGSVVEDRTRALPQHSRLGTHSLLWKARPRRDQEVRVALDRALAGGEMINTASLIARH